MIYEIKEKLIELDETVKVQKEVEEISWKNKVSRAVPYVEVISLEEWKKREDNFIKEEIKDFDRIVCSRIEEETDCLWGTFMIPVKNNVKEKRLFFYIIKKEGISFIDHEGFVDNLVRKIAEHKTWKRACMEGFLYTFLESLIEHDYIYLHEFENKLTKLEDSIVNGGIENFNHKMMAFRKEIAIWHNYYLQLIEIGRKFRENESEFFREDGVRLFELFSEHVKSLQNSTQFLREYAIQIREVYQTQIDIKQNKIMEILTIMTTLFLPLTLITGWYGMNFEYMPEIKWKYGYPVMILVSIVVVIICMRWFKRKKLL